MIEQLDIDMLNNEFESYLTTDANKLYPSIS